MLTVIATFTSNVDNYRGGFNVRQKQLEIYSFITKIFIHHFVIMIIIVSVQTRKDS